jgi:hypothetical protein
MTTDADSAGIDKPADPPGQGNLNLKRAFVRDGREIGSDRMLPELTPVAGPVVMGGRVAPPRRCALGGSTCTKPLAARAGLWRFENLPLEFLAERAPMASTRRPATSAG